MKKILLPIVLILLSSYGCNDSRVIRAASLFHIKTVTAKQEFREAAEPEEKIRIADEYFENATDFTQGFNDYLQGTKPASGVKVE